MDDYAKYEKKAKKIRKDNEVLLEDFAASLASSGLVNKTIDSHVGNIEFFINDFLLGYDAIPAKDGIDYVDDFLGNWFIRKTTWASQAHIKGNAASFKKFYAFMLEKKIIGKEDLDDLKTLIKENMSDWLSELQDFDDLIYEDSW